MLCNCIIMFMHDSGNNSDDDIDYDRDEGGEKYVIGSILVFVPDVKFEPVTFIEFRKFENLCIVLILCH